MAGGLFVPQPTPPGQTLLGTVEVSFDRATHSKYLTLNPPAKAAYVCNTAGESSVESPGAGTVLGLTGSKADAKESRTQELGCPMSSSPNNRAWPPVPSFPP